MKVLQDHLFVCLFFPPVYILTHQSFHLCIHPSVCLPPLPSSLTVCLLATASPDSRGDESWRIRKQLLSCQSPAFCSQLPTLLQRRDAERESESRRGSGGLGWSDKIRTEWGSDITQREMKDRESETESWCWNLSKKTLFLSPSVFLSLCFSDCFDVFRQTHSVSMVKPAHSHNTTLEECQLVVRGTCCLTLFLLPNCIFILSWRSGFLSYCLRPPSRLSCCSELQISHLPNIWLPGMVYPMESCFRLIYSLIPCL